MFFVILRSMARILELNELSRSREIDSSVKNKFCLAWLQKGVEVRYIDHGKQYTVQTKLNEFIKKVDIPGKAVCTLCDDIINYSSRGCSTLICHANTKKHIDKVKLRKTNQVLASSLPICAGSTEGSLQPLTPMFARTANAEAMLLGTLAEYSLPLSFAPRLIGLAKELNRDPKALAHLSMDRTTASYKMRYGLAKTFHQQTLENLRSSYFSLNIDECTSTTHKRVLAILVSYFSEQQNQVVVEHLESVEMTVVNSQKLYDMLSDIFAKYDIPWNNLMSILMDSCNVMRGSKSGLETRIRKGKAPHLLDVDGDSCHHIHNACKRFCKPFDHWLEGLFLDVYNDTKWSPDIRELMAEVSEMMGMKYSPPEQFVSHRWLSCYNVAISTLRMLDVYYMFYYAFVKKDSKLLYQPVVVAMMKDKDLSEASRDRIRAIQKILSQKNLTEDGKKRKQRIVEKVLIMRKKTSLIMNFYVSVLPILKKYVCMFQTAEPMIHKLHDEQIQIFIDFLSCFVNPNIISNKSAKDLKHLSMDPTIFLPANEMFVGKRTEDIIRKSHKDDKTVTEFRKNVLDAFTLCAKQMQMKLPLDNPVLHSLSAIDPTSRGYKQTTKCLKKLGDLVSNVLLEDEQNLYVEEIHKFQVDRTLIGYSPGARIDVWWGSIAGYPSLTKLVKAVLSIFHGPMVESSFNVMGDIVKPKSSRINIPTFSAIQTVKYSLRAKNNTALEFFHKNDVQHDCVSKPLVVNMRHAAAEYKQELIAKREEKEKKRKLLQVKDQELESKAKARKLKEAADKVARIAHQRAQKRKAEENLKQLVKKRHLQATCKKF